MYLFFARLRASSTLPALLPTLGTIPVGIALIAAGVAGLAVYACLGSAILLAHCCVGR